MKITLFSLHKLIISGICPLTEPMHCSFKCSGHLGSVSLACMEAELHHRSAKSVNKATADEKTEQWQALAEKAWPLRLSTS